MTDDADLQWFCLCGQTDLNSADGYWKGCTNPDCPGIDYTTVDPADHSLEFSPHLERMVLPHLGEGWVMESGSPGGDFVLWKYSDDTETGLSPHLLDEDQLMHWYLGVHDSMGAPIEIEYGPLVTEPGEKVAEWALATLTVFEQRIAASAGASAASRDGESTSPGPLQP